MMIPKGKLVVLAGISGSSKSSLAYDMIAVESSRQWQYSYPLYLRNKMPHYERPKVDSICNLTPAVIADQKPIGAGNRSTVGTAVDVAPLIRLLFSRIGKPSAGGRIYSKADSGLSEAHGGMLKNCFPCCGGWWHNVIPLLS